jgi:superfamily II RNA helicase
MAVNLVGQVGRARAREILETSFAQFQADRAVVGLARQARRQEEALAGYAAAMACHLGDFAEYAGLRRQLSDRESELSRRASRDRRADALVSLEKLRRGDVIRVLAGRRAGWVVVVDPGMPAGAVREALNETIRIWSALDDRERQHRLDTSPEPDLGLAWAVHRWANGHTLESVLADSDLAAGDFVRWCKQVIDLLGQIETAAGTDEAGERLRRNAAEAIVKLRRGVVAYSSVA